MLDKCSWHVTVAQVGSWFHSNRSSQLLRFEVQLLRFQLNCSGSNSIAQVPTQLLRFQVSEIQLLRLKVNCSGYDQLLRSQLLRLIQLLRLAAIAQVYYLSCSG